MNKTMLLDKYPVYSEEIAKDTTECKNVDDVMARLKEKIEAHPVATYIGEFDVLQTIQIAKGPIPTPAPTPTPTPIWLPCPYNDSQGNTTEDAEPTP